MVRRPPSCLPASIESCRRCSSRANTFPAVASAQGTSGGSHRREPITTVSSGSLTASFCSRRIDGCRTFSTLVRDVHQVQWLPLISTLRPGRAPSQSRSGRACSRLSPHEVSPPHSTQSSGPTIASHAMRILASWPTQLGPKMSIGLSTPRDRCRSLMANRRMREGGRRVCIRSRQPAMRQRYASRGAPRSPAWRPGRKESRATATVLHDPFTPQGCPMLLRFPLALLALTAPLLAQDAPPPPAGYDAKLWARAWRLHHDALVLDTHSDTTSRILDENFTMTPRAVDGHMDLPRIAQGGLDAEFYAIYVAAKYYGSEDFTSKET